MTELQKILLGFVLTSVIGGFIGSWFQRTLWEDQERAKVLEQDRSEATQLYKTISTLTGKRAARLSNYIVVLRDPQFQAFVSQYAQAYSEARDEDASQYYQNLELLQLYFGREVPQAFETVEKRFLQAEFAIRMATGPEKQQAISVNLIEQAMNVLPTDLEAFHRKAITQIRAGKVGRFHTK